MEGKGDVSAAFKKSLPIMAGYLVLGSGFGILLKARGFSIWWALLMSMTMYSGSMQYVAVDLLFTGASLISTAIVTLMVNIRHLFYGVSLVERYKKAGKYKPYMIFALTDETYSLVCTGTEKSVKNENRYYFYLSLFNQLYWIAGCVLGAAIGTLISFNSAGVEFAMTAIFTVVFVQQWMNNENRPAAIIGIVSTAACRIIFGKENFLIMSMITITAALTLFRKYLIKDGEKNE